MTPLVLVHGFMGGSAQWEHSIDQLERHLDIVAVDLPGYGKNAHLPPIDSIVGFADWVIAHLKERGIREYYLDQRGHLSENLRF